MTPSALVNLKNGFDLAFRGELRSRFTDQVLVTQDNFEHPYLAALAIAAGLAPSELQRVRDARNDLKTVEKVYDRHRRIALRKAVRAFNRGNTEKAQRIANKHGIPFNKVVSSATRKNIPTKELIQKTGSRRSRQKAAEFVD